MDFEFRNLMPNLNFNVVSPHRSKSLSFVICPHLLRTPPLHCFLASVVDLLSAAADQLPAADVFFTASDVFFTVADVFFTAAGLAQHQTRLAAFYILKYILYFSAPHVLFTAALY